MNKYYVSWGDNQVVILAGNEVAACMKVMDIVLGRYVDVVSRFFRVSQCGFDEHLEDSIVTLDEVIQIQILSNEFKENGFVD